MTRTRRRIALLALSLTACSPAESYVAADRATYEAIAPPHARYVERDATLDAEQRARRTRLLESWRQRIESAEPARVR